MLPAFWRSLLPPSSGLKKVVWMVGEGEYSWGPGPILPLQISIPLLSYTVLTFQPWRWRQWVALKYFYFSTRLHSITCQKKVIFIITVMGTSNLRLQQVHMFRSESRIVKWFNILWLLKLCSVVRECNLCDRTLYKQKDPASGFLFAWLVLIWKKNCIKDHFSGK